MDIYTAIASLKNTMARNEFVYEFDVNYADGFMEISVYGVKPEQESKVFHEVFELGRKIMPDFNILPLIYQEERKSRRI